jgi:hypothetical protein
MFDPRPEIRIPILIIKDSTLHHPTANANSLDLFVTKSPIVIFWRTQMKTTLTILLTLIAITSFSFPTAGQKKAGTATRVTGREIYGQTVRNIYTNRVLGIRFQIPAEMEVLEPHYVDIALVPTPGQKLIVKSLFNAEIHPVSINCTAMKLPANMAGASGEDVLNSPIFRSPGTPRVQVETLGSTTFAYTDMPMKLVTWRSYGLVRKGYFINITIGFRAEEDRDILRQYIAAADFDWL